VSGHPDPGDHPMSVVRDTDPDTTRRAATYVMRRANAGDWPAGDVATVLEHLGLRAPEKPTGGKTNPIGKNVPPEVQQRRREQKNARERAARAAAKERDAS
jgi:hypothetical protein